MNSIKSQKTLKEWIKASTHTLESADLFFGHGTDNASDEALWIALSTLNIPYESANEQFDLPLSEDALSALSKRMETRITTRLPTAYMTHEAFFCGLSFYVDERVLIPRSPLACLLYTSPSPRDLSTSRMPSSA